MAQSAGAAYGVPDAQSRRKPLTQRRLTLIPIEYRGLAVEVTYGDGIIRRGYGDRGCDPSWGTTRLTANVAEELVAAINAAIDALGEVTNNGDGDRA